MRKLFNYTSVCTLFIFGLMVISLLIPVRAEADTVQVCFREEPNGDVTFFAGTYHAGAGLFGGIIVDVNTSNFTGTIRNRSRVFRAQCCVDSVVDHVRRGGGDPCQLRQTVLKPLGRVRFVHMLPSTKCYTEVVPEPLVL